MKIYITCSSYFFYKLIWFSFAETIIAGNELKKSSVSKIPLPKPGDALINTTSKSLAFSFEKSKGSLYHDIYNLNTNVEVLDNGVNTPDNEYNKNTNKKTPCHSTKWADKDR